MMKILTLIRLQEHRVLPWHLLVASVFLLQLFLPLLKAQKYLPCENRLVMTIHVEGPNPRDVSSFMSIFTTKKQNSRCFRRLQIVENLKMVLKKIKCF
mmetsp:Transcript_109295/g.223238  ORF Transcript_109295/g.223238 Transcript_109295/m.223238 type:complete len:98 (-) Transcript_109295:26-319(-)